MNRLILIGNGFDLAHGYKTSYTDFILAYLKQCCITASNHTGRREILSNGVVKDDQYTYNDILVKIVLTNKYYGTDYEGLINNCLSIEELFKAMQRYHFSKVFKSEFISETIKHCEVLKWVDIENLYFQQLLKIKKGYLVDKNNVHVKDIDKHKKNVVDLNAQLDYLTLKLQEYLQSISIDADTIRIENILDIISEPIKERDVLLYNIKSDATPDNIYFLNFNYTSTIMKYVEPFSFLDQNYNYIHGDLENDINPMIFGFGDEIDKQYQEIEELNANEYFEHIKSFKYFRTSKYHDLIRFLDSNPFQVYIMGHSCGLSDRTMLNQIFEHVKCMSIKIFYYQRGDGTNDYKEKTFEISRHFKDKTLMRKKIIPFDKSTSLPQRDIH